jgi:hypothetical protein
MMKASVVGARIYISAEAKLLDAAYALEIWMLDNVKYQLMRNGNKTMHGVIEYLALVIGHERYECKIYVAKVNPEIGNQPLWIIFDKYFLF